MAATRNNTSGTEEPRQMRQVCIPCLAALTICCASCSAASNSWIPFWLLPASIFTGNAYKVLKAIKSIKKPNKKKRNRSTHNSGIMKIFWNHPKQSLKHVRTTQWTCLNVYGQSKSQCIHTSISLGVWLFDKEKISSIRKDYKHTTDTVPIWGGGDKNKPWSDIKEIDEKSTHSFSAQGAEISMAKNEIKISHPSIIVSEWNTLQKKGPWTEKMRWLSL